MQRNSKQFEDDWWKIRMLIKKKLVNPASPITKNQWKDIKKFLKRELEDNGFESALKSAGDILKKISK